MEAYLAEFPAGAPPSEPHAHDGAEFVYVIAGRLAIALGETAVELDAGDAVYFASEVAHSYRAAGGAAAQAMVVVHG